MGDSINFSMLNSKTRRGRVGKSKSQTLEVQNKIGVVMKINSSQDGKVFGTNGISQSLSAGHGNVPKIIQINPSTESNNTQPFQQNRIYDVNGISPALNSQMSCGTHAINDYVIRRFTEIECERLQGYPDDFTKHGNYNGKIKTISKYQRYKLIGNAVTRDCVKAIGQKLLA